MAIILLVRHGQNEWVKENRLAGWIPDVHLNETGRKQAQEAAARLAHLPIQALYSSPVLRCLETAAYIGEALRLEVQELEAVGEVRYGTWEGAKIKELAKEKAWHAVQHYPSRFRFPEGEALREVQGRAIAALEGLATCHEAREMVAVVSHADLIKLVLAHYLGVHIDLFQRIVISPASVSVLALMKDGMVRILRLNDDGPLQAPPEEKDSNEERQDEVSTAEDEQAVASQAEMREN